MTRRTDLRLRFFVIIGTLLLWFLPTISAHAATIGFSCITNTNAGNCATGQAQFTVDVAPLGGNVLFWFKNTGANVSSITDIYFDDGSLLSLAGLIDADQNTNTYAPTYVGNMGVDFTQQALDKVSPPDLPGGSSLSPPFVVTGLFKADSDNPPSAKGVNPGEQLGIFFTLQSGKTYSNVINDLANGGLRVGIHVQAFANGGSESFVNNPVPVPAAVWLLSSGLVSLMAIGRCKNRGAGNSARA